MDREAFEGIGRDSFGVWEDTPESKDKIWFTYEGKEHIGFVRRVNSDKSFDISVYYINGIPLGRYIILENITMSKVSRWNKAFKRHGWSLTEVRLEEQRMNLLLDIEKQMEKNK